MGSGETTEGSGKMCDEYNPGCECYYCECHREVLAEEEADGTREIPGLAHDGR